LLEFVGEFCVASGVNKGFIEQAPEIGQPQRRFLPQEMALYFSPHGFLAALSSFANPKIIQF
jgi:hypothetical protein